MIIQSHKVRHNPGYINTLCYLLFWFSSTVSKPAKAINSCAHVFTIDNGTKRVQWGGLITHLGEFIHYV